MGRLDLIATFCFRQHDADNAGEASTQRQICCMRPVQGSVDAHQHCHVRLRTEKLLKVVAGLLLEAFFNGIFQVDNHPIGAARQCLEDALRAGSRHKQGATDN
ncbi:hypothetical protein D3C77_686360 [compost metagenome]